MTDPTPTTVPAPERVRRPTTLVERVARACERYSDWPMWGQWWVHGLTQSDAAALALVAHENGATVTLDTPLGLLTVAGEELESAARLALRTGRLSALLSVSAFTDGTHTKSLTFWRDA